MISEEQRRELHSRLVDVLGAREADVLMEHLPPTGWGDVARRSDVDHLGVLLRTELQSDMAQLRTELGSELAQLESRLEVRFATVDTGLATLRADINDKLVSQTRTFVLSMMATMVAMLGAIAGLVH